MKLKKYGILLLVVVLALTGCTIGKKNNNSENVEEGIDIQTKELRQNDYRGGIMRLQALRTLCLDVIEGMKQNNQTIRSSKPNTFWTESGYQDFVSNFIGSRLIVDTGYFNEEQTTWDEIYTAMTTTETSFSKLNSEGAYISKYSDFSITRNEKDDYTIAGTSDEVENIYCDTVYRVLYDCDKDWVKTFEYLYPNKELPMLTGDLLEYGRIDTNSFLIQTSTERLFVELEPITEDTDIRNRTVKTIYYSKLNGGTRTTFVPYVPRSEYDEEGIAIEEAIEKNNQMQDYLSVFNASGDFATRYGVSDSLFLNRSSLLDLRENWVFEDKALSQGIVYQNGILVVVTYNKLSENYERFIYLTGEENEEEIRTLCDIIPLENLVGNSNTAVVPKEINDESEPIGDSKTESTEEKE